MSDVEAIVNDPPRDTDAPKGWASRHPRLSIVLIAGVFYVILFGMCAFVFVLLLRG